MRVQGVAFQNSDTYLCLLNIAEQFAKRLRERRDAADLTLERASAKSEQVAQEMGFKNGAVSRGSWSSYESLDPKAFTYPSTEKLPVIVRVVNTTGAYLLGETDDPSPDALKKPASLTGPGSTRGRGDDGGAIPPASMRQLEEEYDEIVSELKLQRRLRELREEMRRAGRNPD